MNICALADIHGDFSRLELAGPLMAKADIVVVAGDITRSGARSEAARFFSVIEGFNRNIFAVHGNWDRVEVQDLIDEKKYGLHGRGVIVDGFGFFGAGGSNRTPIRTPGEYHDEELHEIVSQGYPLVEHAGFKIMVTHTPPKGTQDRTFLRLRGGSTSIREFIEDNDVDLCICGHIHEAWGHGMLGDTMVVNCGSFRNRCFYTITIDGTVISCEKQKV